MSHDSWQALRTGNQEQSRAAGEVPKADEQFYWHDRAKDAAVGNYNGIQQTGLYHSIFRFPL